MPTKTLFLKTYGKQRRKLSAWISPGNRKQAFDSSLSTDCDVSVFEPAKPTTARARRTGAASRRAVRPAKRKAMQCLTVKSNFEESIIPSPPHPQPAVQSKTTREKKPRVCRSKTGRPAKEKVKSCPTENHSDAENISGGDTSVPPVPHCPQPAQQSKATRERRRGVSRGGAVHPARRNAVLFAADSSDEENISMPLTSCRQPSQPKVRKSRLASVPAVLMSPAGQHGRFTSESEGESASLTKCHKNSFRIKTTSNVHPPSAGRFVTRRRGAVATKSKPPKATVTALNSSDEFSSGRGGFGGSRVLHPPKSRRLPSLLLESSVENVVNSTGTSSIATNPFREISLNESADHSLKPSPRKPIFCSTPSASYFSKRPSIQPFLSSIPPNMSVSSILNTFQADQDSPRELRSAPRVAPPSEERQQPSQQAGLRCREELSDDLFTEPKSMTATSHCLKVVSHQSEDFKIETSGASPSLNLLTTDNESSSHFVSAGGGLEWLTEALMQRCLTQRCTVQLDRLSHLSVTQLCSQTTYSSCLDFSSSVHSQQTNEHPLPLDGVHTLDFLSIHPGLSVAKHETGECSPSSGAESCQHAASVQAERSSENESMEQSASVHHVESAGQTNSSVDSIMGRRSQGSCPVRMVTDEEAATEKKKCLKKCKAQVKRLSQFTEAVLACDDKSFNPDVNDRTNNEDSESPARSRDVMMVKEKCLTDKLVVAIKRLTVSQLKEILQRKDSKRKSSTDTSDPGSDDHQAEGDTNHGIEEIPSIKVNPRKRSSTNSDSNNNTGSEEEILPKRRKISLAPKDKKRPGTSTDRPGTSRKACVSGLSVSRWKNKGNTSAHMSFSRPAKGGGTNAVDCSISELISTQPRQSREWIGTAINFSTPLKAGQLNLSSLLADLTPSTHTWSRLKAALSVHRKGMVLLTPRSLRLSGPGSPDRAGLADISQDLFATPFRTPLPKRFSSQLLNSNSLVVSVDGDLSDAEKVYAECGQEGALSWQECILPQRMKQCVKIGEGTFGEVFSTTNALGDTVALKVIPVEGSQKVNGEDQKTFGEILHEIIISKELSSLKEKQQNQTHGFIGLNDLHCVRGRYPPEFLKAWDTFDQLKGSENDRPDFFEKDQVFIILEFEFGGMDLENCNGTLTSLGVAKSILHQVTAALAVAEQELHFEHRDLHWGNVLVKTTKEKKGSFLLNGTALSVETKGVLVRVIDYSLSRLEIDDLTVSCDISKDEELFMGQGDYQFEIYRLMRRQNGNNWSNYHPRTNVLWLHYLCSKLLAMKYRGSGGKRAKDVRDELTRFYDNVLQYSSATEALLKCPMFQ